MRGDWMQDMSAKTSGVCKKHFVLQPMDRCYGCEVDALRAELAKVKQERDELRTQCLDLMEEVYDLRLEVKNAAVV